MNAGSGRRRDELAGRERLTAEDVAELTGLAAEQLQRIKVDSSPLLPCSPGQLADYSRTHPELRLPSRFLLTVKMNEAGRRVERWYAAVLEALASAGLADTQVDEAAFLEITDFAGGDDGLPDGSFYVLTRGTDGQLRIGVDTESVEALAAQDVGGRPELEAAAEMSRNVPAGFTMSLADIVRWVQRQGGDVQLAIPGRDECPESPEEWVREIVRWLGGRKTAVSPAANKAPKLTRSEIAKMGGMAANRKNNEVRQAIIRDYQNGDIEEKDPASEALAQKYSRSPRTVRDLLKGVEYQGVKREA